MADTSPVFERTRSAYLDRINGVDMDRAARALGFVGGPQGYDLRFFDRRYRVVPGDIVDAGGRPAPFDACVVLSRYLIMCPAAADTRLEWTAFRDFKDAGPLLKYFATAVEGAIATAFRGRKDVLSAAAAEMGGRPGAGDVTCDLAVRFEALPRIGMLMLFNDADEEFGADCRVLFERRTESYLDMECVAILGARLAAGLRGFLSGGGAMR